MKVYYLSKLKVTFDEAATLDKTVLTVMLTTCLQLTGRYI